METNELRLAIVALCEAEDRFQSLLSKESIKEKPTPRTVKIEIEVEVPVGANFIAIDENGRSWGYVEKPHMDPSDWSPPAQPEQCSRANVLNWRDTLTTV